MRTWQSFRLIISYTDARGDRDRDRDRPRHRSRSRSPVRNGTSTSTRTRSPPKAPRSERNRPSNPATARNTDAPPAPSKVKKEPAPVEAMQVDSKTNGHKGAEEEEEDSDDALLRRMMGFSTFKTTQNKKIPGNDVSGVRKEKSTNYRQYMNRTGGFNRPLSPSRD
jgi:U4/U6.U5 tri-snRNP-associated protein 3